MSGPHNHDPKYVGPGAWYALHLMCANAVTDSQIAAATWLFELYGDKFVCERCAKHLREFLAIHKPSEYAKQPEGLFILSWKAHNNANIHTKKPPMEYEKARALYFGNDTVCTAACGDPDEPAALPVPKESGYTIGG